MKNVSPVDDVLDVSTKAYVDARQIEQITYSGNRVLAAGDIGKRLRFDAVATLTLAVGVIGDRIEVYAANGTVTVTDGVDSEPLLTGETALLVMDDTDAWVMATYGGQAVTPTAAEVPFSPYGDIASGDTQAAVQEVADKRQVLSSELTALAALTTTAYGRSLLEGADAAALRTLIDAQPLDSDLTAIAALTTTSFGRSLLTLADAAAARTLIDAQPLDADLTAIAALATTSFGRSLLTGVDAQAVRVLLAAAGSSMIVTAKTASWNLDTAECGLHRVTEITSATPTTVTVREQVNGNYPTGAVVEIYNAGAGALTIGKEAGVTLRNNTGTLAQYKTVTLRRRSATDVWVIGGQLA